MNIYCKYCGMLLEVEPGKHVVTCVACGMSQTIPLLDSIKKTNLFSRVEKLLGGARFDEAAILYDRICAEYPQEAESYWGLVLCRYGVRYLENNDRHLLMTRYQAQPVTEDENYLQAVLHADPIARAYYEAEAQKMEAVRSELQMIIRRREAEDIYLLCSKEALAKMSQLLESLIRQGYHVYSPYLQQETRDNQLAVASSQAALQSARLMLVVWDDNSLSHDLWYQEDWRTFMRYAADDAEKKIIPVLLQATAEDLPQELRYIQAIDVVQDGNGTVLDTVDRVFGRTLPDQQVEELLLLLRTNEWKSIISMLDACASMDASRAARLLQRYIQDPTVDWDEFWQYCIDTDFVFSDTYALISREANEELAHVLQEMKQKSMDHAAHLEFYRDLWRIRKNLAVPVKQHDNIIKVSDEVALTRTGEVICQAQLASPFEWSRIMDTYSTNMGFVIGIDDRNCAELHILRNYLANPANNWNLAGWTDVVSVDSYDKLLAGLRKDGTVLIQTPGYQGQIEGWKRIVQISVYDKCVYGVDCSGNVLVHGNNRIAQEATQWKNVVAMYRGQPVYEQDVKDYIVHEHCDEYRDDYRTIWDCLSMDQSLSGSSMEERLASALQSHQKAIRRPWALPNYCDKPMLETFYAAEQPAQNQKDTASAFDVYESQKRCQEAENNAAYMFLLPEDFVSVYIQNDQQGLLVNQEKQIFCDNPDPMKNAENISGFLMIKGRKAAWNCLKESTLKNAPAHLPCAWRCFMDIKWAGNAAYLLDYHSCVHPYGDDLKETTAWENVKKLCVEEGRAAGLLRDGTVLTAGFDRGVMEATGKWQHVKQIAICQDSVVALNEDGKVSLAATSEDAALASVASWKNIIYLAAGQGHVLGLDVNGCVIAAGENSQGQCDVHTWKDIVYVAADEKRSFALTKSGKLIWCGEASCQMDAGDLDHWMNIVGFQVRRHLLVGITMEGWLQAFDFSAASCTVPNERCYLSDMPSLEKLQKDQAETGQSAYNDLLDARNKVLPGRYDAIKWMHEEMCQCQEQIHTLREKRATVKGLFVKRTLRDIDAQIGKLEHEYEEKKEMLAKAEPALNRLENLLSLEPTNRVYASSLIGYLYSKHQDNWDIHVDDDVEEEMIRANKEDNDE